MKDDVHKCKSSLTFAVIVVALQCQVKLANPNYSYKILVEACGNDDFPFLRAVSGNPPFFFMYRCLFEVLVLAPRLTDFQCALLEHLTMGPSQLPHNSWAMVRAFEILCPFFNIRPSVPIFLNLFQMKLIVKIDWVFLNNVSKKLVEFNSNVFFRFKDCFFKVLATDVVADGLQLMFNRDGESRFPFYWQSDPTRFKSFDEDLLTLCA